MLKIVYDYQMNEMANVSRKKSGLPMNIWLDSAGSSRNIKHNTPRVKIQNNYRDRFTDELSELIPVSISKNPEILVESVKLELKQKDIQRAFKFISDNYDVLMSHWNGEIDDQDALNILLSKEKDY